MTITYATGVGGYSARRFVCTHNDPLCSYSAVVFVLEDGRWYGDALCADHAPTSALRSLAAAEAGKGACTPPPAAAEVPPTNHAERGSSSLPAVLPPLVTALLLVLSVAYREQVRTLVWLTPLALLLLAVVVGCVWLAGRLTARPPMTEHLRDLPQSIINNMEKNQ